MKTLHLGIVGATGLVGQEALRLAQEILGDVNLKISLFASTERTLESGQKVYDLEKSETLLSECDFIINAANAEQAQWLSTRLRETQVLVDNSSAFRMDSAVPLVVPEVNPEALDSLPKKIVANPNCTAALLCVALKALKPWGLKRVVVSTYQSASGAGLQGLKELEEQLDRHKDAPETWPTEVFGEPLLLNVLSHNSSVRPEGTSTGELYNDEEWKMIEESRKMLSLPKLWISATCVRVPVKRAHTESVTVDLDKEFELADLRKIFSAAPGISYVDVPAEKRFPSPQRAQDQDLVLVGRLRRDASHPQTLHMLISGDQLRKGAASNALQIIKALFTKEL